MRDLLGHGESVGLLASSSRVPLSASYLAFPAVTSQSTSTAKSAWWFMAWASYVGRWTSVLVCGFGLSYSIWFGAFVGTADSQILEWGITGCLAMLECGVLELVMGVESRMGLASVGVIVLMLGVVAMGVVGWAVGSTGTTRLGGAVRLVWMLIGFAVGMVLVIWSGDMCVLFVGWECIGVMSVVLVGFYSGRGHARLAGLKASV